MLIVFSLSLVGCSNQKVENKDNGKTFKVSNNDDENSSDDEDIIVDYKYSFSELSEPKYNVNKLVKFKKNYKKVKYKLDSIEKLIGDDLLDFISEDMKKSYTSYGKLDTKTYSKKCSSVMLFVYYYDRFNKDSAKSSVELDYEDYELDDFIVAVSDMSNDMKKKIKKSKINDEFYSTLDGEKVFCRVRSFGNYKYPSIDDVNADWLKAHDLINKFSNKKQFINFYKESINLRLKYLNFSYLTNKLDDICTVDVPDDLVIYYVNKKMLELDARVGILGKYENLDDYFTQKEKVKLEDYMKSLSESIGKSLETELMLEYIFKDNKLKVNNKTYSDFIELEYFSFKLTNTAKSDWNNYNSVKDFSVNYDQDLLSMHFKYYYTTLLYCINNLNVSFTNKIPFTLLDGSLL